MICIGHLFLPLREISSQIDSADARHKFYLPEAAFGNIERVVHLQWWSDWSVLATIKVLEHKQTLMPLIFL